VWSRACADVEEIPRYNSGACTVILACFLPSSRHPQELVFLLHGWYRVRPDCESALCVLLLELLHALANRKSLCFWKQIWDSECHPKLYNFSSLLFSSQKLALSVYCHEAHPKKGGRTSSERNTAMVLAERLASVALIGKTPLCAFLSRSMYISKHGRQKPILELHFQY
jgi:hypothetical protein